MVKVSCLTILLGIAQLVLACLVLTIILDYDDKDCTENTINGVTLKSWLIVGAIVPLACIALYLFLLLTMFIVPDKEVTEFLGGTLVFFIVMEGLWNIAWIIVGGIVLFKGSTPSCFDNARAIWDWGLAVFTVNVLAVVAVWVESRQEGDRGR